MRNPLFTEHSLIAPIKKQWQDAEEYLQKLANQDSLRGLFREYWVLIFQVSDEPSEFIVNPKNIALFTDRILRLFPNQSVPFVDSLVSIISQKSLVNHYGPENQAAMLIAVDGLIAALICSQPERRNLDLAYEFLHSDFFLFDRFESALIAGIQREQLVKTWVKFLSKNLVECWILPDQKKQSSHEREIIEQELSRWKLCEDPFFARRRHYENNYVRGLDTDHLSRILLMLDVDAWLLTIDKLPLPQHIWGAARTPQIREDGDMIRLLISKAPPVFDVQGLWTRSILAIVLAELIYDHAKSWHGELVRLARIGFMQFQPAEAVQKRLEAETSLKSLENGDLQTWMFQGYQTLIQRADGQDLALRLLAQLARITILGDWQEKDGAWRLSKCALDALATAWSSAGLSAFLIRKKWNEFLILHPVRLDEEEDQIYKDMCRESLPILIGAIDVFEAQIGQSRLPDLEKQKEAADLWSWFLELLQNQDLDVADTAIKKGFAYALFSAARLLWHLPAPCQSWELAYQRLDAQRRNLASVHNFHSDHAFDPSDFLISVGIGFVHYFLDIGHSGCSLIDIQLFVWALMRYAFYLYLTAVGSRPRRTSLQCTLADCLCLMVKIYPNDYQVVLEFSLSFLSKDDALIDLVYKALLQRGIPDSLLQQMFASASLDQAASAAKLQNWKELLPA